MLRFGAGEREKRNFSRSRKRKINAKSERERLGVVIQRLPSTPLHEKKGGVSSARVGELKGGREKLAEEQEEELLLIAAKPSSFFLPLL